MALKITNVNELKYYKDGLIKCQNTYEEITNKIIDAIKLSAIYWQGEDGNEFREKLFSLIKSNKSIYFTELDAEIEYVNKLIIVLENAQEQIKNRLNW